MLAATQLCSGENVVCDAQPQLRDALVVVTRDGKEVYIYPSGSDYMLTIVDVERERAMTAVASTHLLEALLEATTVDHVTLSQVCVEGRCSDILVSPDYGLLKKMLRAALIAAEAMEKDEIAVDRGDGTVDVVWSKEQAKAAERLQRLLEEALEVLERMEALEAKRS